jgi:hypothetical protein
VNACSPRLSRLRPEWPALNPPRSSTRLKLGVDMPLDPVFKTAGRGAGTGSGVNCGPSWPTPDPGRRCRGEMRRAGPRYSNPRRR